MGKGEIAHYEQFLLFPKCFQKACFPGASKGDIVWEWVNKSQNVRFVLIKSICRQQFKCDKNSYVGLRSGRKHCGSRRKYWWPAFSPFPTMFSKAIFLFFRVIKSLDCLINYPEERVFLKTLLEKDKMLVASILPAFSPFSPIFSVLPKTKFYFFSKIILSSANTFILDKSKNLAFGKELKLKIFNWNSKWPELYKKKFNLIQ